MLTVYGRGDSNDRNRLQAQKVRIYRSDRWIAIKFFNEFPEAVFYGVAWNPYFPPTAFGRGHSNDRNGVQSKKVCIYRSDRWIALKFFHEFP